jgi:hypothetical protein
MFRIKICGNRNLEEIELAVSLGADALGLIVGVCLQPKGDAALKINSGRRCKWRNVVLC